VPGIGQKTTNYLQQEPVVSGIADKTDLRKRKPKEIGMLMILQFMFGLLVILISILSTLLMVVDPLALQLDKKLELALLVSRLESC